MNPAQPPDTKHRAGTGAPSASRRVTDRGIDLVLIAVVAVVLRLPAFFARRSLVFDDGVFGSSVLAMRAGGTPFREVFSSQGPLFLPLAWFGDLVTFRTFDSPRALAVASGVVLSLATYVAGRELTTRPRALLATGLVLCSGSVLWTSAPLTADGPASACAVLTVALALIYRRAPSTRRAIVIGVLAGAAFAIKSLLVIPALVAVGLLVVSRRRSTDIVVVPGIAAAVVVLASIPWGIAQVFDQAVLYHTDAAGKRVPLENLEVVVRALVARDLPLVVAALVAVGAWLWHRGTGRESDEPGAGAPSGRDPDWIGRLGAGRTPMVVWALLVGGVLLAEHPMWRSHVAHLVPPLALLVATARVRWPTLAVAAALAVPVWVVSMQPLLLPAGPDATEATVGAALRSLPPGAMVISDEPGIVWRNGRRPPDRFVDTSILRIESHRADLQITEDDVVRDAASPRVCGVVRWSAKRFGQFTDLGARLRREGYERRFPSLPEPRAVWLKDQCRPHGPPPPAWPARRGDRATAAAVPGRSPD